MSVPKYTFEILLKYTNKRARNMKFISMFLTASAVYIRGLPQIYKQTSEINKVYFVILQRVQCIFEILLKYTKTFRLCTVAPAQNVLSATKWRHLQIGCQISKQKLLFRFCLKKNGYTINNGSNSLKPRLQACKAMLKMI